MLERSGQWLRRAILVTMIIVAASRTAAAQDYPIDVLRTWGLENNKGWVAFDRGDLNTAELRFNGAIKVLQGFETTDQRLLSRSYFDLALVLEAQKRHAAAEPLAKWVLKVRERDPRTRDDTLFDSLYLLARIHRAQDQNAEAEALLRRALEIEERNTPADDPGPALTIMDIADLAARQKKYEEADALYRRAIAVLRHYDPDVNPTLADALEARARVFDHLNRPTDARAAESEARRVREAVRKAAEPDAADPPSEEPPPDPVPITRRDRAPD